MMKILTLLSIIESNNKSAQLFLINGNYKCCRMMAPHLTKTLSAMANTPQFSMIIANGIKSQDLQNNNLFTSL